MKKNILLDLTPPVIGILRGVEQQAFGIIMDNSFAAGLRAIEITMNTKNAAKILAAHRHNLPAGHLLGMGTIRNLAEAKQAIDAGAMFLVSPNTNISVIKYAVKRDIPIIAGALTPTEVYTAWEAGAAMIKIFPSSMVGADYFAELAGPFDHIALVAVGGITRKNLSLFLQAGAKAVGVSSSLFGNNALNNPVGKKIKENVANFIDICLQAKKNN
jgi:2-dehydro-3-deoxyphosphogluconate aldolase/(4S)-4-hydroxy-2-oxoglutarate aldolase